VVVLAEGVVGAVVVSVVVVEGVSVQVLSGVVVGGSVDVVICVGVGTVGAVVVIVVATVLLFTGMKVIVGCDVVGGTRELKGTEEVGSGNSMLVASRAWQPTIRGTVTNTADNASISFAGLLNTTRL
jgi:hypothetical protein